MPAPLLYLSALFEATRADYYDGLRGITEKGDWLGWLQYFLNGVARQAGRSKPRRAHQRAPGTLAERRNKVSGDAHAKVALRMVDMLGGNPFVTPRGGEKHLGMAYNTVMRAGGQLEKHGSIKEVSGAKRDRRMAPEHSGGPSQINCLRDRTLPAKSDAGQTYVCRSGVLPLDACIRLKILAARSRGKILVGRNPQSHLEGLDFQSIRGE